MGEIFLSGQNQYSTRVKMSYFGHTFHLTPKKVCWWVGGQLGEKCLKAQFVSVFELLDTHTQNGHRA